MPIGLKIITWRETLNNDENDNLSMNSGISTTDTDPDQGVIRENLAAEPGPHPITLSTLLEDPDILANIIIYQTTSASENT
jgi:hypothetical protein